MPAKSAVNNARGEKGVSLAGGQSWDTIRVARKGQRNRRGEEWALVSLTKLPPRV